VHHPFEASDSARRRHARQLRGRTPCRLTPRLRHETADRHAAHTTPGVWRSLCVGPDLLARGKQRR